MTADEDSLYNRIGGKPVLRTIVNNFTLSLQYDSDLAEYFDGMGREVKYVLSREFRKMLTQYTGGPGGYSGQPLSAVLGPLGIAPRDWDTAMNHMAHTMNEQGINGDLVQEMMAVFRQMQQEVLAAQGKTTHTGRL